MGVSNGGVGPKSVKGLTGSKVNGMDVTNNSWTHVWLMPGEAQEVGVYRPHPHSPSPLFSLPSIHPGLLLILLFLLLLLLLLVELSNCPQNSINDIE